MTHPAPHTFAENVVAYALAGWTCILPVPVAEKYPPPTGYTGAEGRDTPPEVLAAWASSHLPECRNNCQAHGRAGFSIALRMPLFENWGVIGIDVDAYEKAGVQKQGAVTLAAREAEWGPLPATWVSSARVDGISGIRFYRVPSRRYATKLTANHADGSSTSDVEIIQRHHRYAVVWPSPNPQAPLVDGAAPIYRWYDPTGRAVDAPPKPQELPELPAVWVEGLAAGATDAGPAAAAPEAGHALLDQLLDDWRPECAEITNARLLALTELDKADAGSRHDTMTSRIHHLVQLAAHGHTGSAHAILVLRDLWARITAGEDRDGELERMLHTSARKAVTAVGPVQVPADPCLLFAGGFPAPPAPSGAPVDENGDEVDLHIVEPPRWAGPREVIGAHAFDPVAGLDQPLAEAVLERTYPALRYAYDANGWLLRAPQHWELHGRLSPWAVATVATLMPLGDITADKESEAYARAQRRGRLMSTPGARAVAGKMDDLVAGGMHPAAVALADLDSDPEVLWAGGVAWSLRESRHEPVVANVDPSSPHMHSTGIAPAVRPTPLWDAFLAAVWPDPEIRAWAVRVLSITLTGYADRALPILIGETGRGKTQVVHLLMSVLGSYAHAADSRLLTPGGENAHASIVFALKGRRLSFIDEGPREGKVAQERLKQLTGGGVLTANQMHQNPITFVPSHTLVLTTNDEPPLTDPAVRSRSRLIPCDGDPEAVRLTRAAIGHVSSPQWRAEAPGVLASMITEAAAWLADPTSGLVTAAPESIRYLAEHIGAEQDPVAVWVAEETAYDAIGTPSRELYQAFTASCLRNNLRRDAIPSETKWGRQLTRLGVEMIRTKQGKRRSLVLRAGGGHLPVAGPGQQPTAAEFLGGPAESGVHSSSEGAQLVHGSESNCAPAFPQVNPPVSDSGAQLTSSTPSYAHTHTHDAHVSDKPGEPVNRAPETPAEPGETAPDLQEHDGAGLGDSNCAPKPARQSRPKSPEQLQKAAEKREAKRLDAIAAVAGARVEMPAVVTRDGAVRSADLDQADQLLATLTGQPLTVDVENTGYPLGHENFALRTVQLGGEHFAVVLDPHDPGQADVIRRHLAAAPVLHAHSATADLAPLAAAGLLDYESGLERMIDTAVLAKLADPTSTDNSADLKGLAKAVLKDAACSPVADDARAELFKAGKWLTETEVTTPLERSGWAQVDPHAETMVRYAASDVLDCGALATRLPALEPRALTREKLAQTMTARIALRGVPINGDQVGRLLPEHEEAKAAFAARIHAYGIENPGSPVQVGARMVELGAQLPATATGKPSVKESALEPLAGDRDREPVSAVEDLARLMIDWREHDTALKLFLRPYHELVTRGDGRARPTVYTLGAKTGRMSCVRPNLQQLPREGGFRACITADPGHALVSVDFSQVEIRVAAALSGDPNLRAIIAEGDRYPDADNDLHWQVARIAFGPHATKSHRYKAKRKVFGRIYGQGVTGMANTDGAGIEVAKAVIAAMDAITPGLTEWSRMVREAVEAGRTQFPSYSGRVIHLPKAAAHAAPNYCIQGTARELLIDALERWSRTPWGSCTLWPVHDEVVAVVPEDQAADATAALAECMTSELYGIPIVAEPSEPSFEWKDSS